MNAFLTTRRRAAAATLAAGALLVGGAGAAIAPASAAPSSPFGLGTTAIQGFQGAPGAGGAAGIIGSLMGGKGTTGLPGVGVFKALFALLGAVQSQVPGIAAPIIAQAQTAGTITPAEATQLTGLLARPIGPIGAGAGSATAFGRPSTGELTVLHQVIVAVLGQLPAITAPVLAAEVANTDLTQGEADAIAKIIARLASISSNPTAVGSAASGMLGGTQGAGNLLAALEQTLGGKSSAKPAKKAKHHKHRKTGVSLAGLRSH
ncbi:MAG: hypothetical protein QOH12_2930 [Solirubrobacteraceae bacterium]|jgi:hypothetical protein|nr:hypothetical protein [Solirubrobacteraceae bacterium]